MEIAFLITIVIIVLGAFLFVYKLEERQEKKMKDMFREFVIAAKSENTEEYVTGLPDEGELPTEEEDELIDLDQADPEQLLKAIKKDDNIKD